MSQIHYLQWRNMYIMYIVHYEMLRCLRYTIYSGEICTLCFVDGIIASTPFSLIVPEEHLYHLELTSRLVS